jgi:hypothetical protein
MMRLARTTLTLIPCLLAFSSAMPASARGLETVWLQLPDCATPPYDPRELLRSLEIELSPYHLRVQTRPAGDAQRGLSVSVELGRCDPRADSLTLVYGDALGQRSRAVELPLRDVPRAARARTLALVIAEALRPSRWLSEKDEQEQAPAPDPSDEESSRELPLLAPALADPLDSGAPHDFPAHRAAAAELALHDDPLFQTEDPYPWPHRLQVGFDVQALLEARHDNLLLGFGLSMHGALLGHTQWALEASYFAGEAQTPDGDPLKLRWWIGAVGVDLPLASSPRLQLGPRLSVSRLESADSSTAVLLTTCGGRASLHARITPQTSLNVHLEVDRSLRVVALTPERDSLPWYGWTLIWGAGLSFDI